MHRLYLLRHAEAASGMAGVADFDRPLTQRGREQAAALGLRMRDAGHFPGFVLCSSAKRARETWEALAPGLPPPVAEALHMPELYHGDESDYLTLIGAMPPPGPLLVVGHNPTMQNLCRRLAGEGDAEAMAAMAPGFPAGGLALIEFTEPLSHVAPHTGRLYGFLPPRA